MPLMVEVEVVMVVVVVMMAAAAETVVAVGTSKARERNGTISEEGDRALVTLCLISMIKQ